jgi:hypothetical protein
MAPPPPPYGLSSVTPNGIKSLTLPVAAGNVSRRSRSGETHELRGPRGGRRGVEFFVEYGGPVMAARQRGPSGHGYPRRSNSSRFFGWQQVVKWAECPPAESRPRGALTALERLWSGSGAFFQLTLLGNATGHGTGKPEQQERIGSETSIKKWHRSSEIDVTLRTAQRRRALDPRAFRGAVGPGSTAAE